MSAQIFKCIDGHTCGNPVRVVTTGAPPLQGKNMSEKRAHFLREYDWIRTGLMFEPRGHDMMSGCFFYPPSKPENDLGILFIETSGCLPMCGHGTIGAMTIGLQEGLIQPKKSGIIRLETPAGLVIVHYQMKGEKVEWVRFNNVKSYLAKQGLQVDSSYLGKLSFDVAYGGNFYAIFDPQENFRGLQAYKASELILMARELRERINTKYSNLFIHLEDPSINGVSHVLWTGDTLSEKATARNAVFYGEKAIDRSPCGTGTSARMAQWHAQGKLNVGEDFIHESYIGSTFVGRIEEETQIGHHTAIIPSIEGWAKVYGHNSITIDEEDPFCHGFQVI
jgi:4-hydroxyproline epimerase